MSRMINLEAVNSAIAVYEEACLNYYRKPCEETVRHVIDSEHCCVDLKVRRSELTRIRLSAMNAVLEERNNER